MKNSVFLFIVFVVSFAALSLSGCREAAPEPPGPVMTEVYDDEGYTVDAGDIVRESDAEGRQISLVRLHIANRTPEPLYISTPLCVSASAGNDTVPCSAPTEREISGSDIYNAIDGRIAPGGFADGYIVLPEFDNEEKPVTVYIATDFCSGKRISFVLGNG